MLVMRQYYERDYRGANQVKRKRSSCRLQCWLLKKKAHLDEHIMHHLLDPPICNANLLSSCFIQLSLTWEEWQHSCCHSAWILTFAGCLSSAGVLVPFIQCGGNPSPACFCIWSCCLVLWQRISCHCFLIGCHCCIRNNMQYRFKGYSKAFKRYLIWNGSF